MESQRKNFYPRTVEYRRLPGKDFQKDFLSTVDVESQGTLRVLSKKDFSPVAVENLEEKSEFKIQTFL